MQKDKKAEIKRAIELAFKIQEQGINHVFIDYYGHTDSLSVRVLDGKWDTKTNNTAAFSQTAFSTDAISVLADDLQDILENGIKTVKEAA